MKRINQKATKDRIKQLRVRAGLTHNEISEELLGGRSRYTSMEGGTTPVNEKFLYRLANFYNLDFDEICIYEEDEYDQLENTMNILDSYRPTNYYMVRHGNLEKDIVDLIKYFERSNNTEYNLIDTLLNNLDYEVKLINIHDYIEKWTRESDDKNPSTIMNKAKSLLSYFNNTNDKEVCVLIINKNEPTERCLINIDEYIEMEKHIYLSLIGNLEYVVEEYYQLYKALSPTKISGLGDITDVRLFEEKNDSDDNVSYKPEFRNKEKNDLDIIISDNMKEEENDAYFDGLIFSQAKKHLFKIEEYLEKLLDMEDELDKKNKKGKYKS